MRPRRVVLTLVLAVLALVPAPAASAHTVPVMINHTNLEPTAASNYLGHPMVWTNRSPIPRTITESRFQLFLSNIMLLDDTFTYESSLAGTFAYRADFVATSLLQLTGTLTVEPLLTAQRTGRARYQWGFPGRVPENVVFEVQRGVFVLHPGHAAGTWKTTHRGTGATSGWFTHPCDGRATFIRVRVRNTSDDTTSGWAVADGIRCARGRRTVVFAPPATG